MSMKNVIDNEFFFRFAPNSIATFSLFIHKVLLMIHEFHNNFFLIENLKQLPQYPFKRKKDS